MESPRDPEQKGQKGVVHDNRPDSAHEAEVKKAEKGSKSVNREDHDE